jgi:uncharacterized protein (TIGR03435 family)
MKRSVWFYQCGTRRRFSALILLGAWITNAGVCAAQKTLPERFEVASVRQTPSDKRGLTSISPSGSAEFRASNVTLALLIGMAYGIRLDLIMRQPQWLGSELYDVSANPGVGHGLTYKELQPFLQDLLRDRFHLVCHAEEKMISGYALVVAKSGFKLHPSNGGAQMSYILPNEIQAHNISMAGFADALSGVAGRPVVDRTEEAGTYDVLLHYSPDDEEQSPYPSVFASLQEELGLKLVSQKVPVDAVIIEHVDRVPTEN